MADHSGKQPEVERLRAFVEGELPEAERQAFRNELGKDPELDALTEAYAVVVEATGGDAPVSHTRFEDLDLDRRSRMPRIPVWRLVAAAVLLVAVGIGVWSQRTDLAGDPALRTVTLGAVAMDAAAPTERPPPVPELLADYRPFGERGLNWIRDLDQGLALARLLSWPVVLFVDHPTCPICAAYEKGPFRDRDVGNAAQSFVLIRRSWNEVPKEFLSNPNQGWPLFFLVDGNLKRLTAFKGWRETPEFEKEFVRLKKRAARDAEFEYHDIERLRALAETLRQARAATQAGERYDKLSDVAAKDADTPIGENARHDLAVMAADAHAALIDARAAEPAEALEILDRARVEFAGTPYEADFRDVADFVREHDRFPDLQTSR